MHYLRLAEAKAEHKTDHVFTALHPLLLWGALAVTVPILIHLLLRQKPRPRPWAAMRWLLAASQAAQRRYKLTNLLLLLLRCLILLLLALTIARPSIAGLGGGARLVLVVDRSASMGERGSDPGPLAAAKAALAHTDLSYRQVVVLTVADKVEVIAHGSMDEAVLALAKVEASHLPGGLDQAASRDNASILTNAVGDGADAVLISDFQQDDGALLQALMAPRCRHLARWVVGQPCSNAVIGGIDQFDDLRPNQPGKLIVHVMGEPTGVELSIDDGPFLRISSPASAGLISVSTPPMDAGDHHIRIRLQDKGLSYDNLLELPVNVRGPVSALAVAEHTDLVIAGLNADNAAFTVQTVRPAIFPSTPLPAHGLVTVRSAITDSARLAQWVTKDGGVLWAGFGLLHDDPNLRTLVQGITLGDAATTGGPYHSGIAEVIDQFLDRGGRATVPSAHLPASAEVVLSAGHAPLVVAVPAQKGWVIVELANLDDAEHSLEARGTTPLWTERVGRRYTARLGAPRFFQAGLTVAAAMSLTRQGAVVTVRPGDALMVPPGLWQAADGPVVVVPSISEGQLAKTPPTGSVSTLDLALPHRPGIDWGLPLAILVLLVALGEGAFAAWAGRVYGT